MKKNKVEKVIRLNKFISNSGLCTRRDADNLIKSKKVFVNGKVIDKLGSKVLENDIVKVNGKIVKPYLINFILINKPKGFSCKNLKDSKKSIFSILSNVEKINTYKSQFSIDQNHLGLVLLSNEKQKKTNFLLKQLFHLKLKYDLKKDDLKKISKLKIENKIVVRSIDYLNPNVMNEIGIEVYLKNIKSLVSCFKSFGSEVTYLDRVAYLGLTKFKLARGQWRFLNDIEILNLKN